MSWKVACQRNEALRRWLRPVLVALAGWISAAVAEEAAPPVLDPVQNYLAEFHVRRGEEVIISRIDLNGDGTEDVFISRNTLSNGRQGNIWVYYESLPGGGYARIDELAEGAPIEFHQKAVSFRPRRDGKGLELVRYSPGGAGEGLLAAIRLGGGSSSERILEEFRPGADMARYDGLFANEATRLRFVAEPSDALLRRYFPFGRWFLHMTPLKWSIVAVVVLGLLVVVLVLRRILLAPRSGAEVRH